MTVMVIAQPTLNPAMLSVGFNVAALKLEKEGLPPAPLPPPPVLPPVPPRHTQPHQVAAMPPMPTSSFSTGVAAQMPIQPPPLPPVPVPTNTTPPGGMAASASSSGNLSVSQSGGIPGISAVSQSNPRLASASVSGFRSESQDTMVTVPDAVGKHIMDALLKALARHIGPFAKLIMKEELTKLGLTPLTLGFAQYDDFVSLLSRRVQDPAKRREFITEAEALPNKR
jgi:hypothetical protein